MAPEKDKNILIRTSKEVWKRIAEEALSQEVSRSELIRRYIDLGLMADVQKNNQTCSCPFCGYHAMEEICEPTELLGRAYIRCKICLTCSPPITYGTTMSGYTKDQAIDMAWSRWNYRPPATLLNAEQLIER